MAFKIRKIPIQYVEERWQEYIWQCLFINFLIFTCFELIWGYSICTIWNTWTLILWQIFNSTKNTQFCSCQKWFKCHCFIRVFTTPPDDLELDRGQAGWRPVREGQRQRHRQPPQHLSALRCCCRHEELRGGGTVFTRQNLLGWAASSVGLKCIYSNPVRRILGWGIFVLCYLVKL